MKPNLITCVQGCQTLAVMGICKNAGKTTVLNTLIHALHTDNRLGITSIGYDGEETDQITMQPKPRIHVYPGMRVATTEQCALEAQAEVQLISGTEMDTAMGPIVIVEVIQPGMIEVAGPSMASQIHTICTMMQTLGCDKVLVDGAAGRLSFAAGMDGAILAVGAALSNSMRQVVRHAYHQVMLLNMRAMDVVLPADEAYVVDEDHDPMRIYFRGPVADTDLKHLMHRYHHRPKCTVVKDASAVFISSRTQDKWTRWNGSWCAQQPVHLKAVTLNPTSPYGVGFEPEEFLHRMEETLDIPVFDVILEREGDDEQ